MTTTGQTMADMTSEEIDAIWEELKQMGSREAYIERKLEERGLRVAQRDTKRMSKSELKKYKRALKEESAARKELRQKSWVAYKKHKLVHLGEGIFWNEEWDFDKFDHPRAEERAAENNIPKLGKPEDLAEALDVTMAQLRWLTYHREAARDIHYTRFTIPKRRGGEREIWAPRPILKGAQRWILREIVERLPVHGAAHGFVPGRSTFTNASHHTNSRVLIKADLKDFFPTVTFPRVKGIFRKAGYREQLATLLSLLCTEPPRQVVEVEDETYYVALGPRSLPQGAPTSPGITNTLCLSLDRRLTGLAESLGWRYTRYADDLTFSYSDDHPEDADARVGSLMGGLKMIVDEEGFVVHPDKTCILRKGSSQRVTGLVVNGKGDPRVPRKTRRVLRAAVHNLEQGKGFHPDESIYSLLGWGAYVYMTDRQEGAELIETLRTYL